MIYTQEAASKFIQNMTDFSHDMPLKEFINKFRIKFYPECEFEFMEYFLELSLAENANKFIIPHEKLYEYGITIDTKISSIRERIDKLELRELIDFEQRKFPSLRKQGGTSEKHQYLFTPKAFKLLLMSATKHKKHDIDVSIYRRYYLFLEEVVAYYQLYQLSVCDYKRHISENKFKFANTKLYESGCKIDKLRKTIEEERKEARKRDEEQQRKIDQQTRKMDELLGHATDIKHQNTELKDEIKIVQEQNVELNSKVEQLTEEIRHLRNDINGYTNLVVKTCITPSIVSNLIELFSNGPIEFNNKSPHNGIQPCKVMYFATFINNDSSRLTFWLACRNFAQIPKRMNEQFERATNMKLLCVKAIAICDKDVNEEMSRFEKAFIKFMKDFNKNGEILMKIKQFTINVDESDNLDNLIDEFVKRMRIQFLMRHQKGVLMAIRNNENLEKLQAKEAFRYCIHFNEEIISHTQNYVDSFLQMKDGVVERVLAASDIVERIKTELRSANGKELFVKRHIYHMYQIKLAASRYEEEQYIRQFAELQNQKDIYDDTDLEEYDIENFDDFSDPES